MTRRLYVVKNAETGSLVAGPASKEWCHGFAQTSNEQYQTTAYRVTVWAPPEGEQR
jgi:hypothetical protein